MVVPESAIPWIRRHSGIRNRKSPCTTMAASVLISSGVRGAVDSGTANFGTGTQALKGRTQRRRLSPVIRGRKRRYALPEIRSGIIL
jgi:hypothetical protein